MLDKWYKKEKPVFTGITRGLGGFGFGGAGAAVSLGTEDNPATSAQALRDAGITTDGVYYINTPDGGVQQVYCMFTSGAANGGDYGWMLVCRFAANASNTVRNAITSVRSLTDVTQDGGSRWSADFGTFTTTEVRVIGCSDSSDWMANRTTDWIYIVPSNQTAMRFFTNQTNTTSTNKVNQGSTDTKRGMVCNGARDGRNRWTNNDYVHHRVSDEDADLSSYVRPAYFKAPGADMWYYHGGTDAKWSVGHNGTKSGQDTDSSALFGYDDGNGPAWFDVGTGSKEAQNSTRVDTGYTTAAFIFIR